LDKKGLCTENEAATYIKQSLQAVQYIHSLGIIHRDLKLENLLLQSLASGDKIVKIADFGLAAYSGKDGVKTKVGTPDYVAPEVLLKDVYNKEADVWSLGIVTYIL
jgi:serine/threonine protein kinase